jgi:hypothetical protein
MTTTTEPQCCGGARRLIGHKPAAAPVQTVNTDSIAGRSLGPINDGASAPRVVFDQKDRDW